MSAADGQEVAELTVCTLWGTRAKEYFMLLFEAVKKCSERYGTELPTLPRKRKAPIRFEDGTGDGFHPVSVEDHYRLQYCEALDSTIAGIKNRFNQPGYIMYKSCFSMLQTKLPLRSISSKLWIYIKMTLIQIFFHTSL